MALVDGRSPICKISYYAGVASSVLGLLALMTGDIDRRERPTILLLTVSGLCALVDLLLYFYLASKGARPPKDHLILCLPIAGILLLGALVYLVFGGLLVGHG